VDTVFLQSDVEIERKKGPLNGYERKVVPPGIERRNLSQSKALNRRFLAGIFSPRLSVTTFGERIGVQLSRYQYVKYLPVHPQPFNLK